MLHAGSAAIRAKEQITIDVGRSLGNAHLLFIMPRMIAYLPFIRVTRLGLEDDTRVKPDTAVSDLTPQSYPDEPLDSNETTSLAAIRACVAAPSCP